MTEDDFAERMAAAARTEGHMARLPEDWPPPSSRPVPKGTEFGPRVKSFLLDGYGVEDIALKLGKPVAKVRAHVAALRERGDLARWFSMRGKT